ncbi:hypothetical protein [Nocardia vermiculata]|uniref:Uncharacterized protein n=1 Tax=Nocardia vermiculata TaxID=257274 RepID=A0A846XSS8_9NOCA|nr:hypothetical protein [Nocardia vermiculata]NKY50143.1 hypothetical protein [Nocardia vermiculata]
MAGVIGIVAILGIIILVVGMVFIGVTLVQHSRKRAEMLSVPPNGSTPDASAQQAQWSGQQQTWPGQQTQWPQRPYTR